jgi:hypothetical protein
MGNGLIIQPGSDNIATEKKTGVLQYGFMSRQIWVIIQKTQKMQFQIVTARRAFNVFIVLTSLYFSIAHSRSDVKIPPLHMA